MARFDAKGIDDLMKDLSLLDAERIAPLMLEEAVPILEKSVKRRTAAHKKSGALNRSIKSTKPKQERGGHMIAVRPTGKDEKGIRNMEKAIYMEYGTSKQVATPVFSPAVRESEDSVCDKMQQVFDRETKKL